MHTHVGLAGVARVVRTAWVKVCCAAVHALRLINLRPARHSRSRQYIPRVIMPLKIIRHLIPVEVIAAGADWGWGLGSPLGPHSVLLGQQCTQYSGKSDGHAHFPRRFFFAFNY